MPSLGVNIDHVATLRQARQGQEPDPVWAAAMAELAGADCITVHLREDRRHINERDVKILRQSVRTKLNLEMSIAPEIVSIALDIKPHQATLVPEKRQEITTEGGLDVAGNEKIIKQVVNELQLKGIVVSLFIDPEEKQVEAAKRVGAEFIELHTGRYANIRQENQSKKELEGLSLSASQAQKIGLRVNAGHGLDYWNIRPLVKTIPGLEEVNIGHAIISRAVFVGLEQAVREMKNLCGQ